MSTKKTERLNPLADDAWEPGGGLGESAAHAVAADAGLAAQIDAALTLQPISIRLPKSTIDTYKQLAQLHGVGYQPLMRDAICRWADAELKQLLAGAVEAQRQQDLLVQRSRAQQHNASPKAA